MDVPIIEDVSELPFLEKWQRLADCVAEQLNIDLCSIKSQEMDGLEVLVTAGRKAGAFKQGEMLTRYKRSFCDSVVKQQRPISIFDVNKDSPQLASLESTEHNLISYLGFPLYQPDNSLYGTFSFCNSVPRTFSNEEQRLIAVLRESLEADLRLQSFQRKYTSLAETDEITGLPNTRGFHTQSHRLFEMAKREKRSIIVCCYRLINLGSIWRAHGSDEVDQTLACFAAALKESTRKTEVIGRLGQDMFAIMSLPYSEAFCGKVIPRIENELAQRTRSLRFATKPVYKSIFEEFTPPHRATLEIMVRELSEKVTIN